MLVLAGSSDLMVEVQAQHARRLYLHSPSNTSPTHLFEPLPLHRCTRNMPYSSLYTHISFHHTSLFIPPYSHLSTHLSLFTPPILPFSTHRPFQVQAQHARALASLVLRDLAVKASDDQQVCISSTYSILATSGLFLAPSLFLAP